MEQVTFHYDTVLSDVHMLLPNAHHLMARLNNVGQPVFISKFKILWGGEEQNICECDSVDKLDCDTQIEAKIGDQNQKASEEEADGEEDGSSESNLDNDGDLEVTRRPRTSLQESEREKVHPIILCQAKVEYDDEDDTEEDHYPRDIIRIEHTMATPLEDVGKQVWRGACLLADFILSQPKNFAEATVLELGAGTGLTSVIVATVAKTVYCTDIGEDLLTMCRNNVTLNKHLLESTGCKVRVRELDWLRHDLCTDADATFGWTEDEVADLHDNTTIILAADVCYDDDLTDGLFRTLYRLCSNFCQPCTIYFSLEKRLNFSLRCMDVTCEAYNHFRHCMSELQDMTDGRCSFKLEKVPLSFPQYLQYERVEQLELWRVTTTSLHLD
ncbi:methyltransferase-like protein 22 [Aplochiton taeniatus]